jgi:hypothetical protein
MSSSSATVSIWAPLRIRVFRALWLAVLISNVAIWMQTVGAQWLLVNQPHASILVALVQTADYLPDMVFGLLGGVLADMFDRRRLLMAVQSFLVIVGAALAALTFAGQMPPALLLIFYVLDRLRVGANAAGLSVAGSRPRTAQPAALGGCARVDQHQRGKGRRARNRRRGDRPGWGRGGLRAEHGDVPAVSRCAHRVAPARRRASTVSGAFHVGAARRRPVRALRAGGAPNPASSDIVSCAG